MVKESGKSTVFFPGCSRFYVVFNVLDNEFLKAFHQNVGGCHQRGLLDTDNGGPLEAGVNSVISCYGLFD